MGTLKKFMAHADMVKISCVDTTDVVENARKIHKLNPTPTAALGRLLTMGLMMGTMSKGEKDKLTLQIIGDGPLGSLLVVADSKGNVKGYVSTPLAEAEKKAGLPCRPSREPSPWDPLLARQWGMERRQDHRDGLSHLL